MAFKTDSQTLNDLGIFSRNAEDSIYTIYNKCRTSGGALILDEMFRSPLTDINRINNRASIIRYFQENKHAFPFDTECFGPAEFYIDNVDVRSQLNIENNNLQHKLAIKLGSDADFIQMYRKSVG